MQAMKDEAVADPSALEARVRQEMAQRIKNHEERNQARKLTPAQRKEKKKRKLLNDPTGGGVPVTVYRVAEIPDKQKLYKIDINAQQNHLSGVALLVQGCSVVVVEGGPKAQKRYRKLLLHRIDWSDVRDRDDDSDDDDDERDEERRRAASEACQVVWEGRVVKPQFKSFRVEAARTPEAARKLLRSAAASTTGTWRAASAPATTRRRRRTRTRRRRRRRVKERGARRTATATATTTTR